MSASKALTNHYARHVPLAEKACRFLTASPDPFHAVANSVSTLQAAGFSKISLRERWTDSLQPGGKYFYTLNESTLVAFSVGGKYQAGNAFHILGGHTDSPNLKVKPRSQKSRHGCVQLGVECYGGGLWHTWFDRDLGLSGRVLVRAGDKIESRRIKLDDPVARISTLCIHLQSAEERKAFAVNKEEHTSPIVATTDKETQALLEKEAEAQINKSAEEDEDAWRTGHEPLLLATIADKLSIKVEDIADFELNLFDTQPASLGGISKEFLYSARLDNLATVFCSIEALVHHSDHNLQEDEDIAVVALFDHEEVGSGSATGAGSPVIQQAVDRISAALNSGTGNPDLYASALAKSFCLSIDQAHAVHPNYSSKHESAHGPKMNGGLVIKTNSNQRYATNSVGGFVLRELGRRNDLKIQEFVVRNDCPCGSTIGPIISANTGIRTVDAGMPQLSMHSVREVMGIADLTNGLEVFKAYFQQFRDIDNNMLLDA